MCSISYHGLNIAQINIVEDYLVQLVCKLSYLWMVFLNSNNHNKEIKTHEYYMMSNWNMQGLHVGHRSCVLLSGI